MATTRPPTAQRIYVPTYVKADGTLVQGYWRDNQQTRGLPRLKGGKTFRAGTFSTKRR